MKAKSCMLTSGLFLPYSMCCSIVLWFAKVSPSNCGASASLRNRYKYHRSLNLRGGRQDSVQHSQILCYLQTVGYSGGSCQSCDPGRSPRQLPLLISNGKLHSRNLQQIETIAFSLTSTRADLILISGG